MNDNRASGSEVGAWVFVGFLVAVILGTLGLRWVDGDLPAFAAACAGSIGALLAVIGLAYDFTTA